MWSRESIVEEMATGLWTAVAPSRSPVPRALFQAGEDLAALYEEANHTSLPDIARRMHRVAPDLDVELIGSWLAEAATGEGDGGGDVIARAGVGVPTFELRTEPSGRSLEVTWEGSPARRNPAPAGPRMMLLEDDPLLQEGTGRWMKKFYPDVPLIVVDNVDAAIANLKHHDMSLIVSDVDVIGNQNGIDFFHYVQQNHPDLVDRFVFFTGNSAAESEHYRYLAKGLATSKDLKAQIEAKAPARAKRATKATRAPAVRHVEPTVTDVVAVIRDVAPRIKPVDGVEGRPKTRFGDRKIFISALWREVSKDPRLEGMSFDQFKQALLAAHRERLLSMARADLVAAMDTAAVAASEFSPEGKSGPQYHFVIDPTVVDGPSRAAPGVVHQLSRAPDDAAVLAAVRAELPRVPERGRYGDNVFISALWEAVRPRVPGLTLEQFKRWLVNANRQQQLVMTRADMVDDMDPEMVEQSQIDSLGAQFHFVLDRKSAAARAPRTPSTEDIAQAVLAALPQIKGETTNGEDARGRFGQNKVFIYPIWKIVGRQFPDLTRGQFDRALIVAQRNELLTLARLDTRGHADKTEMTESEISDMGATYHFVLDPNSRGR